uniref:Uncharacterized protein n=1 Tax=Aegilops tauschii TaxID=37682 RepID=M8B822_AEGTA
MTPPSPSLFLLHPLVGTYRPGDKTTDDPKNLLSAKEAFGFPADLDCDALIRGLALEADLAGSRREPVLFVSPSSSDSLWEIAKHADFPDHLLAENSDFVAEEVFSHRGRGYWVDLLLGGMYCDCADLLSDERSVDVRSLDLPVGCERYLGDRDDIPQPRAFRALGCVGDSIKFASITGFLERVDLADDRMVRVWSLKEDMSWDLDYELNFGSLHEEAGAFKGNHLPTSMAPMYPFLSMQEDRVIYFALREYMYQDPEFCFPSTPSFWVRVDMSSKTFNCTPLSLTDASIGCLLAMSGNAEGKLAWTSSQEENVANFLKPCPIS